MVTGFESEQLNVQKALVSAINRLAKAIEISNELKNKESEKTSEEFDY